ncbi:membrane protein insertion efficiency factor YidD [Geoalkalibacter subterraneus]|uniref:membrane protein insertion efficiency factor YidD n=1 Tax=Geoalkalibacter subterraneus TaxID=483547 RepID=UPI00069371B2|nr:membrane protein insertion efficiency factor YidD [Geoalkalibacter subterraneus]
MRVLWGAALILLLAGPSGGAKANAQAPSWGPWQVPAARNSAPVDKGSDMSILRYGIGFFQEFISPVDGPRCPMTPTCSAYALHALDRHGPALAIMLTVDRLLHENTPREKTHPVPGPGRIRYFDPLDNNDFWLPNSAGIPAP